MSRRCQCWLCWIQFNTKQKEELMTSFWLPSMCETWQIPNTHLKTKPATKPIQQVHAIPPRCVGRPSQVTNAFQRDYCSPDLHTKYPLVGNHNTNAAWHQHARVTRHEAENATVQSGPVSHRATCLNCNTVFPQDRWNKILPSSRRKLFSRQLSKILC